MAVVGLAHMMGLPVTHLLAAAAGAAIAASLAWSAQALRYDARIADLQAQHASAAAAAAQEAQSISTQLQKSKDDAIAKAQERAAQNAAAAAAARRTADGLRAQLASANSRISDATHSACTEYARTAGELLGQCSARYSELAAAADGHAADAVMLRQAWPAMPVKASAAR